ncbi:MAG: tRNA pseudouridine(38-40) synthase TruA [Pseudomonadales bacterium]|nr:tRNA pseudouridine(38-40) synthase TruA [Pseudomonadales bacterium]
MRIALGIEFDGSGWGGWQLQGHDPNTVQQSLQNALSRVADHPVTLVAAGRTDAGVHASGMVAHFETPAQRSMRAWVQGTNSYLPDTIAVLWAQEVDQEFHARFRAMARRYRYVIYNHPQRSALWRRQVTWHYAPLDVGRMRAGALHLLGEHDFTSFRAVGCQAKHPVREVQHLDIWQQGRLIVLDIQANGFLHHMVRNIAGVLLRVGEGREQASWVAEVLQARDRTQAAVTAPPWGLYFVDVLYPERFVLPRLPLGPHFIDR